MPKKGRSSFKYCLPRHGHPAPQAAPEWLHEALLLEGLNAGAEGAYPGEEQPLGRQDILGLLHEVHLPLIRLSCELASKPSDWMAL